MRAVIVEEPGGPEALVVTDRPRPEPRPGEVLIEVRAAGVNRADIMQRMGHYPPPPGASDVLGLECAGVVAGLGEGVTGWAVGQECVALLSGGGHAEYVAAPAGQVLAPPPGVDALTAGGVMEVAATVVSNFDLAGLAAGQTVLIHGGSGGIGSFAIQYARALGARVVTTAGTPAKLDYCRELGADQAVDYHDDWVAAVKDVGPVDVVLDNMGAKYLEPNVSVLGRGGQLIVIGLQGGRQGTLDLGALLAKRGTVRATSLRSLPDADKAAVCARVAERVWPRFADGSIRPTRDTRVPLDDVARAHRLLESGDNVGKIVLEV